MIKHLTIFLAFLMMIGSQVSAENYEVGDVFYCNEGVSAFFSGQYDWELKYTRPTSFRFTLAQDANGSFVMKFGSTGYFSDTTMPVLDRRYALRALLDKNI